MSEYKNYWEDSIRQALEQTEADKGRNEYFSNIEIVLSCFNTLIDLAGDSGPLVFAEGIANQYAEEFGEQADEDLVDILSNFGKKFGPDPNYYDALAVYLFRALYGLTSRTDNTFEENLRLQMNAFVELYRRANYNYPNKDT